MTAPVEQPAPEAVVALAEARHTFCVMRTTQHGVEAHYEDAAAELNALPAGWHLTNVPTNPGDGMSLAASLASIAAAGWVFASLNSLAHLGVTIWTATAIGSPYDPVSAEPREVASGPTPTAALHDLAEKLAQL